MRYNEILIQVIYIKVYKEQLTNIWQVGKYVPG